MSESEAQDLLSYILLERAPAGACLRRIGNGEFVIILQRPMTFHVWGWSDWLALRQAEEEAARQQKAKRKPAREETYTHAIVASEAFALAL
jgi:hypothetical protein